MTIQVEPQQEPQLEPQIEPQMAPEQPKKILKNFSILEANTMFLILAGVFLTLGAYVQSQSVLWGLLITEYGIILLPVIAYTLITRKNLIHVLSIHKLKLKSILKIAGVAVTLLPVIAVANLLALWVIESFSDAFEVGIPTANTSNEYLVLMFIISITAGICEESLFRGVVLNAYGNAFGAKWGAIFSGVLFGIFHFNPQNLLGPIILGIVFAYIVQITGSIWAGVFAHAMNNGIAVTMGYLSNLFSGNVEMADNTDLVFGSTSMIIGVIIFYGILSLLTSAGLFSLLKSLKNDYPRFNEGQLVKVGKQYLKIVEVSGDVILLKDSHDVIRRSNFTQLKGMGAVTWYKVWGDSHKKLTFKIVEIVPLILTGIMYGYIIYFAYF